VSLYGRFLGSGRTVRLCRFPNKHYRYTADMSSAHRGRMTAAGIHAMPQPRSPSMTTRSHHPARGKKTGRPL